MTPRSQASGLHYSDPEDIRGQRPISEPLPASASMATTMQAPPNIPSASSHFGAERRQLPPLPFGPAAITLPALNSPLVKPPVTGPHYHVHPPPLGTVPTLPPATHPFSGHEQGSNWKTYPTTKLTPTAQQDTSHLSQGPIRSQHGVKRSYSDMMRSSEDSSLQAISIPPLNRPEYRGGIPSKQNMLSHLQSLSGEVSEPSTPTGTRSSSPTRLPLFGSGAPSVTSSGSYTRRCTLHIRQQPRAARAGPDGKDRRSIDPPPVLQLMMLDFDPSSERDVNELRNHSWVVHTKLISATSPRSDVSSAATVNEDGSRGEVTRLLLGTAVSSPFFCADDPDPESMVPHPTSESERPPSPTSRFIPSSSQRPPPTLTPNPSIPSTFFVFADLSVRKAGDYRLEFRLMKMEPTNLLPGSTVPLIHSVTSQVFRVVNAKDFDQVKPSTALVEGLIQRGAGFPLKLKKGHRGAAQGNDSGTEQGSSRARASRQGDSERSEDEDENE